MQSPRWLSWSEPVSPWRPVPLSPWPPGGAAGEGRDGDLRGLRLAGGNSSLEHSGTCLLPRETPVVLCFAFSRPPHTSAPQKSKLSRGVLMATLPLCQSCVAGIAPSRSRAGFGLSLWADLPLKGFLPGVCFWGPRLSCAETPHHLFPFLGHTPRFVSGNKGLGNGGVGIAVTQWEEEQIGTGRRCHGWEKTPEDGGKGWVILMGCDV